MRTDDDRSLLVVEETQPDPVPYYAYPDYPRAEWPALSGYAPNDALSPYGYFGYPYRYRPYGTYPRHPQSDGNRGWPPLPAGCGAACGTTGEGAGSGWDRSGIFSEPSGGARPGGRPGGIPAVGPQPALVGPQPPLVGPRPIGPRGWQRLPSR